MRLKILIVFALLLLPGLVNAGSAYTSVWPSHNVLLISSMGRNLHSTKCHFLFRAISKMSKEYFHDSVFITVRFGSDSFAVGKNIFHDHRPIHLGYASHIFDRTYQKPRTTVQHYSVNIYITKPDFSTRDCLELIYYALTHRSEIENDQKYLFIKGDLGHYFESYVKPGRTSGFIFNSFELIPSISENRTKEILSATYVPVEKLLQERLDGYGNKNRQSIINPYLKNDSFFYYIVDSSKGHQEKIILRSNEEGRIESDGINNDLIMLSETAWHYTRNNQKLAGPIKMPDIGYLKKLEEPHLASSLHSRSDSELVITKKMIFDQYTMVYNTRQQTIYLDTLNLSENLKLWLKREEEEKHRTHFTNEYSWQKTYRKTIVDHTRAAVLVFAAICILAGIYIGIKKYK